MSGDGRGSQSGTTAPPSSPPPEGVVAAGAYTRPAISIGPKGEIAVYDLYSHYCEITWTQYEE